MVIAVLRERLAPTKEAAKRSMLWSSSRTPRTSVRSTGLDVRQLQKVQSMPADKRLSIGIVRHRRGVGLSSSMRLDP